MDYYLLLLAPGFACLFWGMMCVKHWKRSYSAQRVMALNLFLSAFSYFCFIDYLMQTDSWTSKYVADVLNAVVLLLLAPLCVRYFRLLTDARKLKWWNHLMFLPALSLGVASIVLFFWMGHDRALVYVRDILNNTFDVTNATGQAMHMQISIAVGAGIWLFFQQIYLILYALFSLRRYRRDLDEFYSNTEGENVELNYLLLGAMVLWLVLMFASLVLPVRVLVASPWLVAPIVLVCTGTVFVLARGAHRLKYTARDMAELMRAADHASRQYDLAPLEATTEKRSYPPSLLPLFNQLIDDEQFYLQPNLRIDQVSRKLLTCRTYVSRMINEEYEMSFSEFINTKRVDYAKELIRTQPHLTQEELADQTGFLYASSLSRMFKQKTGLTPKAWGRQELPVNR